MTTILFQSIGDEYIAPKGLPEWKQPGFDDDDRVREKDLEFKPQGFWGAIWFMKNEMTVAKTFYFCFFGAFGSLFPLFSVFFKGIAMDAFQTGFLVGIRPIIEYLATPFWHGISDRFQAGKVRAGHGIYLKPYIQRLGIGFRHGILGWVAISCIVLSLLN